MSWQPIETAPKDGTWIIVCGEDYSNEGERPPRITMTRWVNRSYEQWEDDGPRKQKLVTHDDSGWDYPGMTPTHWMPLPEPPK